MRQVYVVALFMVLGCGEVKNEGVDAPPDPPGDADVDAPPIETCTPNEFVDCDGQSARVCNETGDGAIVTDCGAPGCNMAAGRCNECVPDSVACGANNVLRCGPDGLALTPEACTIGCTDAPEPHCSYIEPRYDALADICDAPATMPALDIAASQAFDTGADIICTGGVVPQTGGPEICVIRYGTITIQAGRTLTVRGRRAVAFVSDGALTIDGVLDASADGTTNGPGGGSITSGARGNSSIGGGGAGARTAGGNGGSDTQNGGGALGGAATTNPADLVAFVGGPRPPTSIQITDPDPGGGGGAVMLVSCRGIVDVSANGVIDAGGGGGSGGRDIIAGSQISFVSAAGGGAGGNIVLQGTNVRVLGSIFANGGGGGGGTGLNDTVGAQGQDGRRLTTAAAGGAGAGVGGGGGSGGVQGVNPGVGLMPGSTAATPGGGGASVGFAQTYTPMGVTPTITPAAASPAFGPNRTIQKR